MAGSGKEDLRVAAERLQRGIDRFGNGDLAGALIEFEEVLKLYPESSRGPHFNAWIQKVQLAARVAPLDEDALHGIEVALSPSQMEDTKPERPRRHTSPSAVTDKGLAPPERERRLTPPPPAEPPSRERKLTPPPVAPEPSSRPKRLTPPTPLETAATMQLPSPPPPAAKLTRDPPEESPWDPVPLTPRGSEAPPEVRGERRPDKIAELQSQATKAAPPPIRPGASSSTILGMPPLEPKLLTPQNRKRNKVNEDPPESVTREFRPTTPTNPNLQPLDVPELTDEQIQGLLSLDSPLLGEGRTTPQIELDRIDGLDDSSEQRLIELEAMPEDMPEPEPAPTPLKTPLKNDTNPMGVEAFRDEFEPPTGVKPASLKPVREPDLHDDPYSDLNLLPLEVAPDLSGPDEVEEGGTNPTNPFIRGTHGRKLAELSNAGPDVKLEDMPPLPSLPGTRTVPGHPLGTAEAALQAGDLAAAVDACETALSTTGGLQGELARDHLPLVEQIYGAMLGGADRIPVHGRAVADLEPRSAFLLSRLDGSMTVEDVLDVSGMPRLEALRTMALLVRRGAVVIK